MKNLMKEIYDKPYIFSKANVVVEASDEFFKLTGFSKDEITGKTLDSLGKIIRIDFQINLECIDGKNKCHIFNKSLEPIKVVIICMKSKDSDEKYLIFEKDSNYEYNNSFYVNDRMEMEQKNKELEAIFENMFDGLFILDNDNNYIRLNKKAKEFMYRSESIKKLGDSFKHTKYYGADGELLAYDDMPTFRVKNGEVIKEYYLTSISPDGVFHYCLNGLPIYDENGNVEKSIFLLRDVTDRLKYEENLYIQTQNDTLKRIIKSLNLGFLRISYPDLKIIDINNSFYDILKQKYIKTESLSDIVGMNIFDCLNKENDNFYLQNIKEALQNESNYKNTINSYSYTEKFVVYGEEKYFKIMFQPLYKLNKDIAELIVLCFDVTSEIKEKNEAEENLKTEEEFFINITHELKTPLNVIFSANQLMESYLKEGCVEKNKSITLRNFNIIKQNCYRLTKLINNIVDLSKIESGILMLNCTNNNIVELVENIVQSISEYIKDKGLNVVFDTNIEEKIIAVDADKIERVILNLISNAIKFSDKGNEIDVMVLDRGEFVEIHVKDNGVGMEKEHLDMIFNRFGQIDKTLSRNAEGSGIGLSLVKSIVEMHEGKISVESEVGKGSIFKIKLPSKTVAAHVTDKQTKLFDNKIEMINVEFSDIYSI